MSSSYDDQHLSSIHDSTTVENLIRFIIEQT